MIFLKKGEHHQCEAITVTLKNGALDLHPKVHGTYELLAVTINGYPCWTSSTHAIWYGIISKQWRIGLFNEIGVTSDFLGSSQDDNHFLMPCEENCWEYYNTRFNKWQNPKGYGLLYNANDINIQCTSKL